MKNILLLIIILILSFKSYSQDNFKVDSLMSLLHKEKIDSSRVNLLNQISWNYINSDFDKSLDYAMQALDLAKKIDFNNGIGMAYTYIAFAQYRAGNYKDALFNINKSIGIFEILNNKKRISKAFLTISNIYLSQSLYDEAINYCNESIKMKNDLKDSSSLEFNYQTFGIIYNKKGDYTKALENFFKSIKFCKTNNNNSTLAGNYNNIAIIYRKEKKYNLALEYYQKALEINKKTKNKIGKAEAINNMAIVYESQKHFDLALKNYEQALKIYREINSLQGIAMVLTNISGINITLKKLDNVGNQLNQAEKIYLSSNNKEKLIAIYGLWGMYYLEKDNIGLAISYSKKGYEIAKEINTSDNLSKMALQLSSLYEKASDYKTAFKYYQTYHQTKDSIFNLQKTEIIEKMTNDFKNQQNQKELELKTNKIEILEKTKKTSNYRFNSLLGAFIMLFTSSFFAIKFFRKKIKFEKNLREKEKKIKELEIQTKEIKESSLQSEIEYKDKEIQNFAFHIIDKNNFILKIQDELKQAKTHFNDSKTTKEIQSIISLINSKMLLERDRQEFLTNIDQINKNFYFKIKQEFSELTETEIRVASLLRMGFTSKEISAILYITPKSVDTNRYRIRKKLNLPSNLNLGIYFKNI